MYRFKYLVMPFIFAFILFGCGSSGGSSSDTGKKVSLSGIVSDGPIKDSVVKFKNKKTGKYLEVETTTKENGVFNTTVKIATSDDIHNYIIEAKGGKDTVTDVDFTGVVLKTDMALFDKIEGLVISPITSMVTEKVENGAKVSVAKQEVQTVLDIEEKDLLSDPSKSKNQNLKVKALQIAYLLTNGFPSKSIAKSIKGTKKDISIMR
ncbi:MAG: hypothetical protein CSA86_04055 [Arcobacter sp.]|nr:MAG: hypothetical protein CSA86_04055 [Arcobacter sp.]